MTPRYRPVTPEALRTELAERLAAESAGPALRVAVDGPDCADPVGLARSLVDPLRERGRPVTVIPDSSFWLDASVRLEWGRTDVESRLRWLDSGALVREVLAPLGPDGPGSFLPSLRDPDANRSTREPRRRARPGEIVIVAGAFLLQGDLDFDVTVHLAVSAAARQRRTPADEAWTLAAHLDYDARCRPSDTADVVVRYDDPARPAVRE